jgi:hypothetical protein
MTVPPPPPVADPLPPPSPSPWHQIESLIRRPWRTIGRNFDGVSIPSNHLGHGSPVVRAAGDGISRSLLTLSQAVLLAMTGKPETPKITSSLSFRRRHCWHQHLPGFPSTPELPLGYLHRTTSTGARRHVPCQAAPPHRRCPHQRQRSNGQVHGDILLEFSSSLMLCFFSS